MAKGESQREASGEDAAPFGRRLRQLREAAGLTQEELAERAGLTAKAISMLERGERKRPYLHTVRSLADALNLPGAERDFLLSTVPGRGSAPVLVSDTPAGATLPVPPTSLLGREHEVKEIVSSLVSEKVRLLTLTGPGGVGKTRLALEAAHETSGIFPGGTYFVTLAPLIDPALVIPTVARSLGLREGEGQTPCEALHAYLQEKRLLLVLDNFEHLVRVAPEVEGLIEHCPNLVVLVTSRSPLRVRSEQEYPVPPLALPASTRLPTFDEVADSPSGRLFVERARAASPTFELTAANAAAVAAICWRLDGLPLALELAAARARFLGPTALLSRLDRALEAGGARDLPYRQRTIRSTLDWSYELLSEPEKDLFARLSVFAGGFTLEAAEAVGGDEESGEEDVLVLLGSLVEQSLILAEPDEEGDRVRYRMLELVRQYALERLAESGEAERARRRHAMYFLALAEVAEPELRGPRQAGWLDELETEHGNLRAVMSWMLDEATTEPGIAARMGWALWFFWWYRGHQREGLRWIEAVLLRGALLPESRAKALVAASSLSFSQGDYEKCEGYAEEALELSRRIGDELLVAHAQTTLGVVTMSSRSDYEMATALLEEGLRFYREADEGFFVAQVTTFLGMAALAREDPDRAKPMFEEALAVARRIEDRTSAYVALYNLALVALSGGDYDGAAALFEEGVTLSEPVGDRANLAYCLEGLATVAGVKGRAERSARLVGAAEGLLEEVGAAVYNYYKPDRSLYERTAASVRSRLGEGSYEEARAEGRAMDFDRAVEYALGRPGPASGTPNS